MATYIKVEPDEVVRTARQIDADVLMYRDSYMNVYRASDEMMAHWAGRDCTTYNERLNGFRVTLTRMEQLIAEYVAFLDRSAADYRATLVDNVARAGQLPG